MTKEKIISLLPYSDPFLFVDELISIDEDGVVGQYTFPSDAYFYKGHFEHYPITPGVILTETMAQIGMVCLGIYLIHGKITDKQELPKMVMVSNQTEYFLPVYPEEKVRVTSERIYFRFGKLKCRVSMHNEKGELVCKGELAGMHLKSTNDQ